MRRVLLLPLHGVEPDTVMSHIDREWNTRQQLVGPDSVRGNDDCALAPPDAPPSTYSSVSVLVTDCDVPESLACRSNNFCGCDSSVQCSPHTMPKRKCTQCAVPVLSTDNDRPQRVSGVLKQEKNEHGTSLRCQRRGAPRKAVETSAEDRRCDQTTSVVEPKGSTSLPADFRGIVDKGVPLVFINRLPDNVFYNKLKPGPANRVSFSDPSRRQLQCDKKQDVPTVEGTLLLVNSYVEDTFITVPGEYSSLKHRNTSMTLDELKRGISSYLNARPYTVETPRPSEKSVEIFCCKMPQRKKYYFYKRVQVVDQQAGKYSSTREGTTDAFYDTFNSINCFIKCFATLAEFTFEFCQPLPLLKSGLCNVLVVDKVWNYDGDKRIYIPSYQLLDGDIYTDHITSSMKRLYGCETIELISTLHTALFANYDVLAELRPVSQPRHTDRVKMDDGVVRQQTVLSDRPFKKRKTIISSFFGTTPGATACSSDGQQGQCSTDGSASCRDSPTKDTMKTRYTTSSLTNPTLVVLKQPDVRGVRHLVCPISIEIHLASRIVYN